MGFPSWMERGVMGRGVMGSDVVNRDAVWRDMIQRDAVRRDGRRPFPNYSATVPQCVSSRERDAGEDANILAAVSGEEARKNQPEGWRGPKP